MPAAARLRKVALPIAAAALALAGALSLAGAVYLPDLAIPPGLAGRHVLVNGNPVRVLQRGAGPDVVLIHGSPGSLEDWEPVATTLAATHRVTTFDRPGHGFSGDAGDAYTPEWHAAQALALMDALDVKDAVVAGHSYGGATALAMALRRSPRVRALVIVDSAAYRWLSPAEPLFRLLALPALGTGFARAVGPWVAPRRIRARLAATFVALPPSQDFEAFVALRTAIWARPMVTRSAAREALGADGALAAMSPRYGEIALPVVVLGQADDPGRRETAERLSREVPGARLHLVAGTGHYLQIERPAEVAAAIEEAAALAR